MSVKITSRKLLQTETNPLEPNTVAKRHGCQNLAHWLDRMVLPGNCCSASGLPGSPDKKLEVHTHTDIHTLTHTHAAVRVAVDVQTSSPCRQHTLNAPQFLQHDKLPAVVWSRRCDGSRCLLWWTHGLQQVQWVYAGGGAKGDDSLLKMSSVHFYFVCVSVKKTF